MRTIKAEEITKAVSDLCIQANIKLPQDIARALETAKQAETWPLSRNILDVISENYRIAAKTQVPICQDTGMACVFIEAGQDVHVEGNLEEAINKGVRQGYTKGYLRKSVVSDPFDRVNTKDNTPAVIYYDIVAGDRFKITVAPKGFGSENMSAIKMLRPSDGVDGAVDFIVNTVKNAGANPCPPVVVGVGIGGTFDKAAYLAKKALLRNIDTPNGNPFYAELEEKILKKLNDTGIGPQGVGGKTFALGVNIEYMPTHIAGLPVAVNINCHVTRHMTCEL